MCSSSWSCCFRRRADTASLQGIAVPCQVLSQYPYCSDSIKVLGANEGGFSDALLGLRRCKTELHPIAALNYGFKEGEEEKGPSVRSFQDLVTQSQWWWHGRMGKGAVNYRVHLFLLDDYGKAILKTAHDLPKVTQLVRVKTLVSDAPSSPLSISYFDDRKGH